MGAPDRSRNFPPGTRKAPPTAGASTRHHHAAASLPPYRRIALLDIEWRVRWRSADWQPTTNTQVRRFTHIRHAENFAAKLRRKYGDRLALEVTHRWCGRWLPGWEDGDT